LMSRSTLFGRVFISNDALSHPWGMQQMVRRS
jgi:hypothetical protein